MFIKCNNIYLPDTKFSGFIQIENGVFKNIFYKLEENQDYLDYSDYIIIPGFIDIHIHGYGRGSFAYKGDIQAIEFMSEDVVKMGITSYLLTSGTMPKNFLENSYSQAKIAINEFKKGVGAEPLGIHMEGPFINEKNLGMQRSDSVEIPSISKFDFYNKISGNNIKLVTLAPEIPEAKELIKHLNKNGIAISAGHTSATFDEIKEAISLGLGNFTHTYSGMRGFHHRELGVVGAAMYFQNTYAEVAKQTGITIKPEAFDILYRLKGDDKLILTTDCLGFGGFPEGYSFYHYLRKQKFSIENNKLKIENDNGKNEYINLNTFEDIKDLELGFLDSVKNVIKRLNHHWSSVIKIASENPAKFIGVFDKKGSIEVGKDADFLVLDKNGNLQATFCYGLKQ